VGADDYLVKPFGMRELLARSRAALRRVELDTQRTKSADAVDRLIVTGPLRIEPESHSVTLDGANIGLTPKEFDLLYLLVANPGRAFHREFLIERHLGRRVRRI